MLDDFTGIASFFVHLQICWSLIPDSARSNFQVLPSDLFGWFKLPFQGLSDLHLGDQKVTWKKLVVWFLFNISFWAILGFPAFLQTWSVWYMLSLHQPVRQFRKADATCKEAEAKAEHCPLMRLFRGFVWDKKTTQLCGDFQRP